MIKDMAQLAYADRREATATVSFGFVDPDAAAATSITTTEQSPFSMPIQILDENSDMQYKVSTIEQDYWRSNGTFKLVPRSGLGSAEVGAWFETLSDAGGRFATNPLLTLNLNGMFSSIGFQIFFDTAANEFPEEFLITVYRGAVAIYSRQVTGNSQNFYTMSQSIDNYNEITVEFQKTAKPYRRVRIAEVYFGAMEIMTPDNIQRINVLDETETKSANLPASELVVSIENQDKRFDIFNPQGVYAYLKERQKLTLRLGFGDDTIQKGVYYLSKWTSETGGLITTLTAQDAISLLESGTYRKSVFKTAPAATWLRDVMSDAGFTEYLIDPALETVNLYGYIPLVSHREAIRLILEAARAIKLTNAYGKLVFRRFDETIVDTINFDNMYDVPEVSLSENVSAIRVGVLGSVSKFDGRQELYAQFLPGTGTYTLDINYSAPPAQEVRALIEDGTLVNSQFYANSCVLTVSGTGGTIVRVEGYTLGDSVEFYTIENGIGAGNEITIENTLIGDRATAQAVAEWVQLEVNRRMGLLVDERGNPAREIGDSINVEDPFEREQKGIVVKQEYEYDGILTCRTETRGRQNG